MNSRMRRQANASRRILNRRGAPAPHSQPLAALDDAEALEQSTADHAADLAEIDKLLSDEAVDAANAHDVDRLRRGKP